MINQILQEKGIVLNGKNNNKSMLKDIIKEGYIHVFTSPEIAISKRFKNSVLDQTSFTDCLTLLTIDEIHLVEEWGKTFRLIYAKIKKIRKRILLPRPFIRYICYTD